MQAAIVATRACTNIRDKADRRWERGFLRDAPPPVGGVLLFGASRRPAGAETERPGRNAAKVGETVSKFKKSGPKFFLALPKLEYAGSKCFQALSILKYTGAKVFLLLPKLKYAVSKVERTHEKLNYGRLDEF